MNAHGINWNHRHYSLNLSFGDILVRVLNFDLGQETFTTKHHNKMVAFEGVIDLAEQVTPELVSAAFRCKHCGEIINISQGGGKCKLLPPETCINKSCESKKPKFDFLQENSTFSNYQEIWLKPFEQPRIKLGKGQKIILKQKLAKAKEGENIKVKGRLSFELKGRTTFAIPVVIATEIKRLD